MKYSLDEILDQLRTKFDPDIDNKLLMLWLGGSRMYGNFTETSDWDFTAVTFTPIQIAFPQENKVHYLEITLIFVGSI